MPESQSWNADFILNFPPKKKQKAKMSGEVWAWILCQELVPRQRMGEVRDEHPGSRETDSSKERHGEHEPQGVLSAGLPRKAPQFSALGPSRGHP